MFSTVFFDLISLYMDGTQSGSHGVHKCKWKNKSGLQNRPELSSLFFGLDQIKKSTLFVYGSCNVKRFKRESLRILSHGDLSCVLFLKSDN